MGVPLFVLTKDFFLSNMNSVHFEKANMNQTATTKEDLLSISMQLAAEGGFGAINIRELAQRAGISVGCVYHYFPSKGDLVAATVEKVWEGIFHKTQKREAPSSFIKCVEWIFESIQSGSKSYPSLLTEHAAGFSGSGINTGSHIMNQYIGHIKQGMLASLCSDKKINQTVFSPGFSAGQFVDFVFENTVLLCMRHADSCAYLCALIRHLVY